LGDRSPIGDCGSIADCGALNRQPIGTRPIATPIVNPHSVDRQSSIDQFVDRRSAPGNRQSILELVTKQDKPEAPTRPRAQGEPVSELTTNRLSVYLRCLNALDAADVRTISSQALAEQFHLNAAQIRKDLANFGEFGVRGIGYYVKELRRHLRQILGLDRGVRVAIIGAGNLGLALADYPGFRDDGFEIVALFDTLKEKIGKRSRGGVVIHDIKEFRKVARRENIGIAVIAVPASAAQAAVQTVAAAGVRAVLNFSPGAFKAPRGVKMKSMDLTVSLESLSFFLVQGGLDE
jgi:redox-sensing transcriptional repressor